MMADFPTALLPRKTILYFTSQSLVLSSNIYYSLAGRQRGAREGRRKKMVEMRMGLLDQLPVVRLGLGRSVMTTMGGEGGLGRLISAPNLLKSRVASVLRVMGGADTLGEAPPACLTKLLRVGFQVILMRSQLTVNVLPGAE